MADLFEHALQDRMKTEAPLAARMRPRSLDEYLGQEHIIGPGKLLRRAIEADKLFSSLILWGPPGTGKTTLAEIIANTTQSHFVTISAILAGKADLREIIAAALERRRLHNVRTILFVDEVHRWNKAQQDALLPHVENGVITLIGATTENPFFEVIKALISRSRIFQLRNLNQDEIGILLDRALADEERGYGSRKIKLEPEARAHFAEVSSGMPSNWPWNPPLQEKMGSSSSLSKWRRNPSSSAPCYTIRTVTRTMTPFRPSSNPCAAPIRTRLCTG